MLPRHWDCHTLLAGVEVGVATLENIYLSVPPKVKHTAQMGNARRSFIQFPKTGGNTETWENLYECRQ